MSTFLGIKFAPLNTPLKRRLQTLAVIFMCTELSLCCLLTYWLYNSRYCALLLLYCIWMLYDRNTCRRGGRQFTWLRQFSLYCYVAQYFPIKLHKTVNLDLNKKYIFGCHPHGITGIGHVINFGTDATGFDELFPGIKLRGITLNINFWIPFHREYALANGLLSADKESVDYFFENSECGNAIVIVVGGAAESLDAIPNTMTLTLKNRKGFVKLALKHG
ncbi:hypothetical protein B4U79_06093 [Dinothrombium tinctorium]|uniref:Acyltransferase n=1 Tax=Dinothrombium tinctorium TaxID=1965070 RepID=A0A443RR83_9ACAR|nr:hypothetical protein B4U79_06093 [Dinothrombium tinctorium]